MTVDPQIEENRGHLLKFIDLFKEAVVNAIDLDGEWKVTKPSVAPEFRGLQPVGWTGTAHTRYTLTIDLLDSRDWTPETLKTLEKPMRKSDPR